MAKRKVLLVDVSLHRAVRQCALDEGRTAKAVTRDALLAYLRRKSGRARRRLEGGEADRTK